MDTRKDDLARIQDQESFAALFDRFFAPLVRDARGFTRDDESAKGKVAQLASDDARPNASMAAIAGFATTLMDHYQVLSEDERRRSLDAIRQPLDDWLITP